MINTLNKYSFVVFTYANHQLINGIKVANKLATYKTYRGKTRVINLGLVRV